METVRTADVEGARPKTLCHLGGAEQVLAQARWLKTAEVFDEQGEGEPLKLFPAQLEPQANDPQRVVAVLAINGAPTEKDLAFPSDSGNSKKTAAKRVAFQVSRASILSN